MIDFESIDKYKENNRIEAKRSLGGLPRSIWETYSAFANTLGGIILLGVEEYKDKSLHPIDLPDPDKLICEFWDIINNTSKVSINILTKDNIHIINTKGKKIIAIEIPRAKRDQKPIYIDGSTLNSYKRNGEGDYRCSKQEIDSMLRDASLKTPDMKILSNHSISVLNMDSIYEFFNNSHKIEELLKSSGAIKQLFDSKLYPTAAGLLMFGKYSAIKKEFPYYSLKYSCNGKISKFEYNLYDFYCEIKHRIINDINSFFNDSKIEALICEAVANCIIHADYNSKSGIEIIISESTIKITNPGTFRIDVEKAKTGGISDPRNLLISKMFNMINVGSGQGKGLSSIYSIFKSKNLPAPLITEDHELDKTTLTLFLNSTANDENMGKFSISPIETTVKQSAVITYLTKNICASIAEIAELLNISQQDASIILLKLQEINLIISYEKDNMIFYKLKS